VWIKPYRINIVGSYPFEKRVLKYYRLFGTKLITWQYVDDGKNKIYFSFNETGENKWLPSITKNLKLLVLW
jgi:hypothetical protein